MAYRRVNERLSHARVQRNFGVWKDQNREVTTIFSINRLRVSHRLYTH